MARFTEWSGELERALAEPFAVGLHTNKGNKGTFVSIHHYVARLNELVGVSGWSMPQPMSYHAGNKMGLAVGVTVLGVTKWNVGDEMEDHGEPDDDGKVRDFGSSSTNSFAQAFKRCMAYGFGCGLYLYDKDWTAKYLRGGTTQRPTQERVARAREAMNQVAPSTQDTGEVATKTQLDAIARLCDVKAVESDLYEQVSAEVNSGTLTFKRAGEIIKQLDKLPKAEAVR